MHVHVQEAERSTAGMSGRPRRGGHPDGTAHINSHLRPDDPLRYGTYSLGYLLEIARVEGSVSYAAAGALRCRFFRWGVRCWSALL